MKGITKGAIIFAAVGGAAYGLCRVLDNKQKRYIEQPRKVERKEPMQTAQSAIKRKCTRRDIPISSYDKQAYMRLYQDLAKEDAINRRYGDKLHEWRMAHGYTQNEFGKKFGYSGMTINNYEHCNAFVPERMRAIIDNGFVQ